MKKSITYRFILKVKLITVLSLFISEAFAQTDVPPPALPKIGITIPKDTIINEPVYLMSVAEPFPRFEGGYRGFLIFIIDNLRYRKTNLKCGECVVRVSFNVNAKGKVIDVNIVKGLSRKLNKEAMRVVKLSSEKWKVHNKNDRFDGTNYVFSVDFKLE